MATPATSATAAAAPSFTFPGSLYNGYSSYGGKGPEVLAVSYMFCGLTVATIAMRTYTTVFVIRRPRLDLYIMIVALALACVSQGFVHKAILHGIGNTMGRVAIPDAIKANFEIIVSVCVGQFSLIIGKVATALLILQIQGQTRPKLKWILYVALLLNTLSGLASSILMWMGCTRFADQWETNAITNPACPRFRISNKVSFTYWAISAATDIVLSGYPALIFLPLNMSLRRRIGLCLLFSGGVIAASFAILRIVRTLAIGKMSFIADYTGEAAETVRWAILEIWIVLLLTNIPPLRPLFARAHSRLSSEDSPFMRLFSYVSRSSRSRRSRNSSSPGKGRSSDNSDVEAQRGGPPNSRVDKKSQTSGGSGWSRHLPRSLFSTNNDRNTNAWSKFSFGFSQAGNGTMMSTASKAHSDSTKVGSENYWYGHGGSEKESYDGGSSPDTWLADNSDQDGEEKLMPPRSKFSVERMRPEPAHLPPPPPLPMPATAQVSQRQQQQPSELPGRPVEMAHHPGAGMITVEREFDVDVAPRRW